MKTEFSLAQLADPQTAVSEQAIRKCVHCGFCTATCPTYVLLGDELDSPRGRIMLMKDMLENERVPSPETVKHIDRCLSCLSCMSTCPSGVNYLHLVDHARSYIEARYQRPRLDRLYRGLLAAVLPYPSQFRAALSMARLAKPFLALLRRIPPLKPLAAMLDLAPNGTQRIDTIGNTRAQQTKHGRVALVQGCVESTLRPRIRSATIHLLNLAGFEVVLADGEVCCGALVQHMGRHDDALAAARRNVDAWDRAIAAGGLDAIVITTSGCGTTIKDYGFMLRNDPDYAEKAASVSALARDVSEFLVGVHLPQAQIAPGIAVAYHSACSLQHGQKVENAPKQLLRAAGFEVKDIPEGHLCCGSAGFYNILQSDIATRLRARKAANIETTGAEIVAAGNIGCIAQIAGATRIPIVHTIELLDWAMGGPAPADRDHQQS